jgi:hypothetical protein
MTPTMPAWQWPMAPQKYQIGSVLLMVIVKGVDCLVSAEDWQRKVRAYKIFGKARPERGRVAGLARSVECPLSN